MPQNRLSLLRKMMTNNEKAHESILCRTKVNYSIQQRQTFCYTCKPTLKYQESGLNTLLLVRATLLYQKSILHQTQTQTHRLKHTIF